MSIISNPRSVQSFAVIMEIVGAKGRAGASINHGWWMHVGSKFHEGTVPYIEEDDRAQQRLIDSILEAIAGERARIESHPNDARRSAISFDAVMAAQRSALYQRPIRPSAGAATDLEIERLREKLKSAEEVELSGHVDIDVR